MLLFAVNLSPEACVWHASTASRAFKRVCPTFLMFHMGHLPAHSWNGLQVASMLQSAAAANVQVEESPSADWAARHAPHAEDGPAEVAVWHAE
jgi:hypothetical protein